MKKKFLIIFLIIIIIVLCCIFIFKNKVKTHKENDLIYETVSDKEEQNITDPVDYHYYVKLLKYEPQLDVKKNATREEREKYYYYYNNFKDAVFELCKKNGDWEYILYADRWDNFNKKDGLLGDFQFNKIERVNIDDDNGPYIYVEASNDKVKRLYHIYWSDPVSFFVDLISEEDLFTNKTKSLELKYFTDDNVESNFIELCNEGMKYPNQYEWNGKYYADNVAVSDNFRNKYPYFLDLFIHYSPLEYNEIALKDLDIEKQVATFEVDSLLECKKRTYVVKYKLTDYLYLDDVEVNKINEIETEATLNNINGDFTFYKNTDWIKYKKIINYTENFYNKFEKKGSIFVDIDDIDYNFKFKEPHYKVLRIWENIPGAITLYVNKYGDLNYYFQKVIYNANNELDDAICKKLPYDLSLSIEEVKEKFLEDKELQKELGINFE